MYYLLAQCVQNKLLDNILDWDIEDFFHYQLSHVLITKLTCKIHKPINPDKFNGYVEFKKCHVKNHNLFIQSACGFKDDNEGLAEVDILLVVMDNKIQLLPQQIIDEERLSC